MKRDYPTVDLDPPVYGATVTKHNTPPWVVYIVQNEAPSERFIAFGSQAEADAWIDRYVGSGGTWQRLVAAPLETG